MITSLLIANRGEIACRIILTARRMGIRTVAVYSDADAKALHVRQADEAVHIGPSPARESYLVGEKIIAAAKATGAEAIHPGYGFLSENAGFAQAVMDAGLVWVGPNPDSITAMGLKDAAKERMIAAGVPVTPGYLGADQDPARLQSEADAIGYPVLIKAVAGGGGKGMRRVNHADEFAEMLLSCQREAASSFGDDRVLIEKYVERPRHIEVQVFGDTHGNVVHLFERDCSLQRRHQKVIEEAPAPGMDEATRAAVCAAAVKAAQAVDYVGAGTIEFIADASEGLKADRIWFMEMNTRLQVEHPVTEEITGVDLVEWQLRVASGEVLPKRQDELSINGWAMEARLYAEDPSTGFLPSTGRLTHFILSQPSFSGIQSPDGQSVTLTTGYAPRIDTGVERGAEVSPYYDPMIAKLIVHGADRDEAIKRLEEVCKRVEVWPVRTNAAFLARLLARPEFWQGETTTGFIAQHLDELASFEAAPPEVARTAMLFFGNGGSGVSAPWTVNGPALSGFRLNADRKRTATIYVEDQAAEAELVDDPLGQGFERDGTGAFMLGGEGVIIFAGGQPYRVSEARRGSAAGAASDGALVSPMPGKIIAVAVRQGEAVTKGQKLLTLEAMKMEHSLVAPFDGVVAELAAEEGGQVSEGAVLARIEKGEG